jgi:hypothetical protein
MKRQAKLSTGNGVLMCAVCDLALADHPNIFTHELSELSLRRLRSSGVLWPDRPGVARQATTPILIVDE